MNIARYVNDRLARQRAHHHARKFAKSVKLGKTYYSLAELSCQPWASFPEHAVRTWTFTRRSKLNGSPMCGPHSAEYVWLNHGPITEVEPKGLRKVFEDHGGQPPAGALERSLREWIASSVQ